MDNKYEDNFISLSKIEKISKEEINKELEEIQETIKNCKDKPAKEQNFDLKALKLKNFIVEIHKYN